MLDFKSFLIENILFSWRVIHIDANSYAHTSGILNSEQSFYHSCFIFSPKNFTFHANELTCLYCLTVFIVFEGPLFQDHELFNLFGKGLKPGGVIQGHHGPLVHRLAMLQCRKLSTIIFTSYRICVSTMTCY